MAQRPVDESDALDTLGAVLALLGRMTFDLGEESADSIRKTFERLAQHVLVGAPLDEDREAAQSGRRDFAAVRQILGSHRRREVDYVVKAVSDLRKTVSAFALAFARTMGDDERSDSTVKDQLGRLASVVHNPDTAAIRREAQATITLVGSAIEKRSERHRAQLRELSSHVRTLSEQLDQAKKAGAIDPLTRIPNRACFDEFLARTTELAPLSLEPSVVFMIDVDKFKTINDSFGHAAGDLAIKAVADSLARTFPRRGDLVARYGGDEFAVILRGIAEGDARALAERCIKAVRALRVRHGDHEIPLTLSIGFALFRDGDTKEDWLARADAALYQAKERGRDGWQEAASG
jgi:diguanylate cyclase (GGDEF)-like protein